QDVARHQLLDPDMVLVHSVLSVQGSPELPHGGQSPGLDRPDRDAKLLGDHGFRVAAEVGPLDPPPLLGGQRVQRLPDLLAPDREIGLLDDPFSYIFAGAPLQVRGSFGPLAEPVLPPDRVDRPVVDEREEEAPKRSPTWVIRFGGPPQGQERIVNHFLGQRVLTGDPDSEAIGGGGVAPVELLEGLTIPRRDASVQLQVEAIVPLHALRCITRRWMAGARYDPLRCVERSLCTRGPAVACATRLGRSSWPNGPGPPSTSRRSTSPALMPSSSHTASGSPSWWSTGRSCPRSGWIPPSSPAPSGISPLTALRLCLRAPVSRLRYHP